MFKKYKKLDKMGNQIIKDKYLNIHTKKLNIKFLFFSDLRLVAIKMREPLNFIFFFSIDFLILQI